MKYKKTRLQAVVLTLVLIGAMLLVPASSLSTQKQTNSLTEQTKLTYRAPLLLGEESNPYILDHYYDIYSEPAPYFDYAAR